MIASHCYHCGDQLGFADDAGVCFRCSRAMDEEAGYQRQREIDRMPVRNRDHSCPTCGMPVSFENLCGRCVRNETVGLWGPM